MNIVIDTDTEAYTQQDSILDQSVSYRKVLVLQKDNQNHLSHRMEALLRQRPSNGLYA